VEYTQFMVGWKSSCPPPHDSREEYGNYIPPGGWSPKTKEGTPFSRIGCNQSTWIHYRGWGVLENRMMGWYLSFVDQVTFCKNIFHVMYRADHCVYKALGTPNLYLGGATMVGSTTEENFFYKSTMITSPHYIHEVKRKFFF
jgi:hypothetical protein